MSKLRLIKHRVQDLNVDNDLRGIQISSEKDAVKPLLTVQFSNHEQMIHFESEIQPQIQLSRIFIEGNLTDMNLLTATYECSDVSSVEEKQLTLGLVAVNLSYLGNRTKIWLYCNLQSDIDSSVESINHSALVSLDEWRFSNSLLVLDQSVQKVFKELNILESKMNQDQVLNKNDILKIISRFSKKQTHISKVG